LRVREANAGGSGNRIQVDMIRRTLRSAFFLIPPPVRKWLRHVLPNGTTKVVAEHIAIAPAPQPPRVEKPKPPEAETPAPPQVEGPPETEEAIQPPRVPRARQLFDANWYAARYREAPGDPEAAYRFYHESGMEKGHHPGPAFENLRCPGRLHIPEEHLYRVTASPILCRVPPTKYLAPYQIKPRLHKLYNTFDEYCRRAAAMPDAIGRELWESDLRVVAYMDNDQRKLAAHYLDRRQDTLISIIMPTRNRATILADAIVSVLMQSYENWELIIVDDASEDREVKRLVRQFRDQRIKYIRLGEQVGIAGARNSGIEHSSGPVIAYLDDEDQWHPDCLLILLNQMQSQGARMAYGAHVMWERFDRKARLGRRFNAIRFAPFNRSLLENTNYIAPSALMHERELLEEVGAFDAPLKQHADWDLILRMTEVVEPIAVPCLLSHSFQGKADDAVIPPDDEDASLRAVHSKLIERSEWSQPFMTTDEHEHLAFSVGRKTRALRRRKLSNLPAETVQIVIPNYESAAELEICLRSIAEHTPTTYHILIVDNGSSEETYEQLQKLPTLFENVRLIKEDSNPGFSFAVNRGLAEVMDRDDKILILNNDTLVSPDWLDELRYVLLKHDDAGMAIPRQTLPAHSKAAKVHVPGSLSIFECDINLSAHHNNIINLTFDQDDDLIELTYAPLFCGLIRPQTIKAAGGLDSGNGPHYRSDWILCDFIRRRLNQRIIYTPYSKVYHLQGVATQKRKGSEEAFLSSVQAQRSLVDQYDSTQPQNENEKPDGSSPQ
jgi:glycosyltransferase involved in cell wall biosynthesis